MSDIPKKPIDNAQGESLWGRIRPWVIAALTTSIIPVLWALRFEIALPSFEREEMAGDLLVSALNVRRLVSIVFLAIGVLLSIPSIRVVFRTSGWRARAAYLFVTLATGVLCFVLPLLSIYETLMWITGKSPTRPPVLWTFLYHDPIRTMLEYALPLPMISMELAGLSLLIQRSRVAVYIVVSSVAVFIALLVLFAPWLGD